MRIELIATDRQSVMLAITPTNHFVWEIPIESGQRFIPGEGSDQSEYSHIFPPNPI